MTTPLERLDEANSGVAEYLRATRFCIEGLDPATGLAKLPHGESDLVHSDAVSVLDFEGQPLSESQKLALAYSLGIAVGAAMERVDAVPAQYQENIRRIIEG